MQVKIFHDTLQKDDTMNALRKHAAKKNKHFDSIEDRVNEFIRDKNVIELQSKTVNNSWGDATITITVLYEEKY